MKSGGYIPRPLRLMKKATEFIDMKVQKSSHKGCYLKLINKYEIRQEGYIIINYITASLIAKNALSNLS